MTMRSNIYLLRNHVCFISKPQQWIQICHNW